MTVNFGTDSFGRLTCSLSHEGASGIATASDRSAAEHDLLKALDGAESGGLGECFWQEACGVYRWVLRRNGSSVCVAVMWSSGTITGWEHTFWTECPFNELADAIRGGLPEVVTGE